jgi:hypothetical protein
MLRGLDVVAERPVTVRVLLWPGSIEVGVNVQLAPDPQARAMLLVNELGAVAVTVKVAVVVPITITVDLVLAESAKTGFPVPVRETLCAPVLALMLTEPVRFPVAVGVKVTAIEQLAPTFRMLGKEPQLLACEKSPLTPIAVRVTAPRLVLESRTTCGALVTPTACAGKDKLLGDSVTAPTDDATPVPVTTTRWGLPAALSLMVI